MSKKTRKHVTPEEAQARYDLIKRLVEQGLTGARIQEAVRTELNLTCALGEIARVRRGEPFKPTIPWSKAKRQRHLQAQAQRVEIVATDPIEVPAREILKLMLADNIAAVTIKEDGSITILRVSEDRFKL